MSASVLETITPSSAALTAKLDTAKWFDATHTPATRSPIDEFLENLYSINKLYLQAAQRNEYDPMLGSLVYLGMVSAAEGYFRSLLRRLVLIDEICQAKAANRTVSYGAAVHHKMDLLPEALLEGISLASTRGVATELKTLCGISQMNKEGGVPHHLEQLFRNFEAICQVRHCGIHRFGKLGSQQALRLGIDAHRAVMEKPLKLSIVQLQDIAEALEALIRGVNSYCFFDIIKRTYSQGPAGQPDGPAYQWTWQQDFASDSTRFDDYYSLFASVTKPNESPSAEDVYNEFLVFIRDFNSKATSKGKQKVAAKTPPAAPPSGPIAPAATVLSSHAPAQVASPTSPTSPAASTAAAMPAAPSAPNAAVRESIIAAASPSQSASFVRNGTSADQPRGFFSRLITKLRPQN